MHQMAADRKKSELAEMMVNLDKGVPQMWDSKMAKKAMRRGPFAANKVYYMLHLLHQRQYNKFANERSQRLAGRKGHVIEEGKDVEDECAGARKLYDIECKLRASKYIQQRRGVLQKLNYSRLFH